MSTLKQYQLDPCRQALGDQVHAALTALLPAGASLALSADAIGRLLEQPPETKLGDYALPCFRFAKDLQKKPPEIASALAEALKPGAWVARAETAGAFLNIFINQQQLAGLVLPEILSGKAFNVLASDATRQAQKVMIEFSQPNTHKEFHVGHARNVCLGNALVRLYRYCGYNVLGANYYGDEGTHIATCLWYITTFGKTAPATKRGEWLGKMYVESKQKLASAANDAERATFDAGISAVHRAIETQTGPAYKLWEETRQWSLDDFSAIYQWLDVPFDIDFYESEMSLAAQDIVDELLAKGVFIEDQGAVGADLKPYKLGFCIVRKRDGNTLYATKDLVLARRKFNEFQIDRSIYVVADEQNHHFKQVFKVLDLMGFPQAQQCFHLSYGMVVLPEGKMSSRDGTSVSCLSLRDVMLEHLGTILKKYDGEWPADEIASVAALLCSGAIKYGMVSTDPGKEIVFNVDDWLSFDGNSGPYLMYSYTRTQSILRRAAEQGFHPAVPPAGVAIALDHPAEHELLRFLHEFNNTVASASENYRPSTLASHLFAMCKSFNRFYAEAPVLKAETDTLRQSRLALTDAFAKCLKTGLSLLGMTPPARM